MSKIINYKEFYKYFDTPITPVDCGEKCAPYNEYGVPFCCDTKHAVPTAYDDEWEYLKANTKLWHIWENPEREETIHLKDETPIEQVLLECLGHHQCQRGYRTITCRAFPFYPYITLEGNFIGLSYYWQYEDRCWIISNLGMVTKSYLEEFVDVYNKLFDTYPNELANFRYHSITMRRVFGRQKRSIPLLHQNGHAYKITPRNGRLRKIDPASFSKYGPYEIADLMPFPDEEGG
jgi:hypothetical protein